MGDTSISTWHQQRWQWVHTSMIKQREGGSTHTPWMKTMFGCRRECSNAASLRKFVMT